jgi:BirA family transcriptional regulator, biotin operon repressor / biotin---[acetyl-CoA-carboxylase] ligase
MQLDPIAAEAGVRLLALGTVGSTNKEARARAVSGETGPLWITAQTQTEGRGRRDRAWISPAGNLYASLLLTEPSPSERAPELAFVAALAVRDAVVAAAPQLAAQLSLKWPNDLLLAGGKCAGILIEGEAGPGQSVSAVIGVGVNCTSHPSAAIDRPATDLAAHGAAIPPQQLFMRLSATMYLRLAQWDRGAGFSAIVGDWLKSAHGVGEEIIVRNGGNERHGRFAGLDPSGRLLLELPGGDIEKIAAGDVFPLSARAGPRAPGHPA